VTPLSHAEAPHTEAMDRREDIDLAEGNRRVFRKAFAQVLNAIGLRGDVARAAPAPADGCFPVERPQLSP